jgi:tetratricopeptide (TPR) repeat protein
MEPIELMREAFRLSECGQFLKAEKLLKESLENAESLEGKKIIKLALSDIYLGAGDVDKFITQATELYSLDRNDIQSCSGLATAYLFRDKNCSMALRIMACVKAVEQECSIVLRFQECLSLALLMEDALIAEYCVKNMIYYKDRQDKERMVMNGYISEVELKNVVSKDLFKAYAEKFPKTLH